MNQDATELLPRPLDAIKKLWSMYCDQGLDIDTAETIREVFEQSGLIRQESYDPVEHGERHMYEWGAEKGDPIYFLNDLNNSIRHLLSALPVVSVEDAKEALDDFNELIDMDDKFSVLENKTKVIISTLLNRFAGETR